MPPAVVRVSERIRRDPAPELARLHTFQCTTALFSVHPNKQSDGPSVVTR